MRLPLMHWKPVALALRRLSSCWRKVGAGYESFPNISLAPYFTARSVLKRFRNLPVAAVTRGWKF